ncbi:MAG TPA: patatin-like phospholipase family protein [Polyangiaceae bacterium]|nr:patatin-like phospholipase family protein [Polyangiaceae bacterium]
MGSGNGTRVGRIGWQRIVALALPACGVAALAMACSLPRPDASMRGLVGGLTYSEGKDPPKTDQELYVYSLLRPVLERPYADCAVAQAQLGRTTGTELFAWGSLLRKTNRPRDWAGVLETAMSHDAHVKLYQRAQDPLVEFALGEAAEALAKYQEATGAEVADLTPVATRVLARVGNGLCQHPMLHGDSPSLALSGGSANGAFVAGFLFELLYLRERLLRVDTNSSTFAASSRFSGVSGTSVGSLLGTVMDLYFTENSAQTQADSRDYERLETAWREMETWRYDNQGAILDSGSPPAKHPHWELPDSSLRPANANDPAFYRMWALALMVNSFADSTEPDVICVQAGSAARLIDKLGRHHPGLMRFDPLQATVLDPLLETAADSMIRNDFRRSVLSVEVSQNVAVALDDSVCSPSDDPAGCLVSGVMASTVLPFFAQPVNRVRTGLSDQADCGIWLDGGLRSGLPAYYALQFNRPECPLTDVPESGTERAQLRMLAISTGRLTGMRSSPADDLLSIAKEAIGEMGSQVLASEAATVVLLADRQNARWRGFACHDSPTPTVETDSTVAPSAGTESATESAASSANVGSSSQVELVFVPDGLPDYLVAGAGYRFDPFIMRGLFVHGRDVALKRFRPGRLEEALGWKLDPARKAALEQYLGEDRTKVDAMLDTYDHETVEDKKERLKTGSERFSNELVKSCSEAPVYAEQPERTSSGALGYFGGNSDDCRKAPQ